jgi:hypothetical protein
LLQTGRCNQSSHKALVANLTRTLYDDIPEVINLTQPATFHCRSEAQDYEDSYSKKLLRHSAQLQRHGVNGSNFVASGRDPGPGPRGRHHYLPLRHPRPFITFPQIASEPFPVNPVQSYSSKLTRGTIPWRGPQGSCRARARDRSRPLASPPRPGFISTAAWRVGESQ